MYLISAGPTPVAPLIDPADGTGLPENGLIALGRSRSEAAFAALAAIAAALPPGLFATAGARECLMLSAPPSAVIGFGYAGVHRVGPQEPDIELWAHSDEPWALAQKRPPAQDATLAVLGFRAPGGSAVMQSRAEALADDVRLFLTRFRDLSVLGTDTVRAWRSSSLPAREIGRRLDAGFALEGTMREAGNLVRIDTALIEIETGRAIWAERYLRAPQALYDLTDEIAEAITAAASGFLNRALEAGAGRPPIADGRAYDLVLQGRAQFAKATPEGRDRAAGFAAAALDLDPRCAPASVLAARCALRRYSDTAGSAEQAPQLPTGRPEALLTEPALASAPAVPAAMATVLTAALAHARQAIASDPFDAHAQLVLAQLCLVQRNFNAGETALDTALRLNPADAEILAEGAAGLGQLARVEDGLAKLQLAMALNPYFPDRYLVIQARLLLAGKQHDEAVRAILRMQDRAPARPELVAALMLSARRRAASGEAEKLLADRPDFSAARWIALTPNRDDALSHKLVDALQRAGLP
ncbi:MAG: hypothetical protein AAGC92_15175 [Pseudomonadota bacterium]